MSDQEHHLRTLIQTLERDNADLRAKLARLDGLTNWVCSCGGTDCKGQEENAALRNEVDEQARLNGKGAERELALRAKVEMLERGNAALRSAAVEVCALARVWATVWHDKLSTESIQRFAELEQQILKGAKP
jgi:hypothetical protein